MSNCWIEFYKIVLGIITKYQKEILTTNEFDEIISPMKSIDQPTGKILAFFPFLKNLYMESHWKEFFKNSNQTSIDPIQVCTMLNKFDSDTGKITYK